MRLWDRNEGGCHLENVEPTSQWSNSAGHRKGSLRVAQCGMGVAMSALANDDGGEKLGLLCV